MVTHPFDEEERVIRGCQWGVFCQPPPLLFVDVPASVFVKAVEHLAFINRRGGRGRRSGLADGDAWSTADRVGM